MSKKIWPVLIVLNLVFALFVPASASGFSGEVPLGAGSYSTVKPPGASDVQSTIYKTANVTKKMPTNDWWSSLAWDQYSERQYPHPLAVQNQSNGFRVYYPGPTITGNSTCVCGSMPQEPALDDFLISHSAVSTFPDAKVDSFNDWFVTSHFESGSNSMKITYGHGSPYVYAIFSGGNPVLKFPGTPTIWYGNSNSPVLGITIGNRHYGLFGPSGSTWTGIGTNTLTNQLNGKNYFAIAVLPDNTSATLTKFKQYAYSHVTDTRVSWSYDPSTSSVHTTYTYTTVAREGTQTGTIFAMYPHQWKNTSKSLLSYTYHSVRGVMKTAEGSSFTTTMKFTGVLPSLPDLGSYNKTTLANYINEAEFENYTGPQDTYWLGKRLGKVATLAPIADQVGDTTAANKFRAELKTRLQDFLKASDASGNVKSDHLFYYNSNWGTLLGYPDSYGSVVEMNDHHFHYGYFIKAAAEVARMDRTWANNSNWGSMINLLIRDIANWDRNDSMFPFLRNFDIYAGHSWASGHARFGDGNNNESSSEAMNAWTGLILWGEATGNNTIRDLGIYLYTTEMNAINEYWFDVHDQNHHPDFTRSTASMIWGGKVEGAGTWWTANPEEVHGINWLPFQGGSLYLTQYPDYTKKNYETLVRENGGTNWDVWKDLIWMYRAIENPTDAINQMNAAIDTTTPEAGNSKANTYHWIHNLNALGTQDITVTANDPLYAVFKKGSTKTYVVYNMSNTSKTVTFSDGTTVTAAANSFGFKASSGGNAYAIPGKIEAENYQTMSGVQTETTTDTGGGQNVGWIDPGDWMDYKVNVQTTGGYKIEYRVASTGTSGQIQLKSGSNVLATTNVPNTGGWQNWTTVQATVQLNAGVQTLRLHAGGGGFNINWINFTPDNQNIDPNYSQTVTKINSTEVKCAFTPTTPSTFVDIHYKVNNGELQNFRMTNNNGTWEKVVGGLNAGDVIDYFYTYDKSGAGYDTQWYRYTH
ncbi:glycosyl hydrolase [Lihuaxuella thermophila]|uniref:glucan endo-1,3-beta-D-glucosidase n=1 Tax=Lihuaxuella thermophila TaxID=1173111 RepID=A0A1H8FE86_9BACL|nr:glycosyl hydrolase [Lihuaxuella thermophila]SEN29880.1 Endoglucanase Acf2 [Lihuaxuella thermophila]